MADIIEQAVGEIIVRDSTAQGVASATKNFQVLYDVVRNNWWGIQNLGNAFSGIGATIAAGLGAAVKASIDFNAEMTQVGRTVGIAGKPLDDMGNALRKMALQKPIDVGNLAKIAADAGALGVASGDIVKFTGTIADLVSTTNLTENSAVQLGRLAGPLGLQGDDWNRLGSAILMAGVNSAATEQDIVNMSVRLSGLAKTSHMTASDIIALAATTTSLGGSAQLSATSIQRFVSQVGKAASSGTPSLKEFAHVAGYEGPKAAQQFANAFNQDAANALAQFVTGLGKMQGNGLATTKVLNDLGFTGQRGAQTLQQLAAGTQQTVNPMLNLNKSLVMTAQAWENNNELQKQAAQVYGSTQSQLKMTENTVHDLAIGFGNVMLPALNMVLKPLTDIVWGLDQLPGPAKAVIAYAGAIAAGLLLLVGGAAVLIPRLVLVKGSILEMGRVMTGLTDTVGVTVRALNLQAEAEGRVADITAFSAARMSKADKDRAVSAYQANIASKQKQITDEAEARTAAILTIRTEALTEMYRAQMGVKASLAEESRLLAAATEAELAGDMDLAEGLRVDAEIAAEDAAAHQRNAAVKMQEADAAAALAAETRALAAAEAEAVVEIEATTIAEEGATAASYGLGAAVDAALGPVGLIIAAVSAAAIGFGLFGGSARKATDAAREQVAADIQLVDIIKKTGQTAGASVQDFYYQNQAFLTAAQGAKIYGYEADQLLNIILGFASAGQTQAYFDKLAAAYAKGDEGAKQQYNSTRQLMLQQKASADAAALQAKHEQETGRAMDDAASAANNEANNLAKLKKAHDDINQAVLDLPGAYLAQRQAQLAVTQAQQALDDAQNAGVKHAEDLKKAEDDLAQAKIDAVKANDAVKAAEQTLASARQDAANKVIDAQNKLADDNDKLANTQDKIAELQAKINEEQAGPTQKELTDATNKLADANIKLLNSQKKVGDAQYMLNYLMAEGASKRDISDAQDQLAAAQQDVADNTQSVADAQDNLNQVRAGADPVQLAKDERDLAAAERDLASTQRDLVDDQNALNQARADQASDKAYKDAQQALKEAQLQLDAANLKVIDSTDALHKVQKENPADTVAAAQIGLESALLSLAKANVQVKKDTALMHGEQFGAGREARALADELDKMGIKAAGPVSAHLKQMSAVLRQSVSDINDASGAASDFGSGAPAAMPKGPSPQFIPNKDLGGEQAAGGWVEGFKKHAKDIAAGILVALGLAFAIVVGGIPALIIGLAAAAIGLLVIVIRNWGPQIGHAFAVAWSAVANFFTDTLPGWVEGAGGAIGRFASRIAGDIANGIATAAEATWNFFTKTIPSYIGRGLSSFGSFAANIGKDIGHGIATAASAVWTFVTKTLPGYIGRVPGIIGNAFSSAASWVEREFNSLINWLTGLPGRIGHAAASMFSWLGSAFKAPLSAIEHLWNSLWEWLGSMSYTFDIPFPMNKIPGVPDHIGMGFGFLKHLEVHIPGLAEGGVVSQPTLAMIGEGHGAEAIMPLDTLAAMFQPIDVLAMQMHATTAALEQLVAMQASGMTGGGGDTFNFHQVMADPVDIVREVVWTKKTRLR